LPAHDATLDELHRLVEDDREHGQNNDDAEDLRRVEHVGGTRDHLAQADLSLDAEASGLFADSGRHRADLITAADVLMYLGNLENTFGLIALLAAAGAVFAFSVEDAGTPEGFHLAPSLRYAHSEAHVRGLCEKNGFDVVEIRRSTIRKDGGKPIGGILFLTRKSA